MPVLGSLLPVSSFIPSSLTAYGVVPSSCRIGLPLQLMVSDTSLKTYLDMYLNLLHNSKPNQVIHE